MVVQSPRRVKRRKATIVLTGVGERAPPVPARAAGVRAKNCGTIPSGNRADSLRQISAPAEARRGRNGRGFSRTPGRYGGLREADRRQAHPTRAVVGSELREHVPQRGARGG